MGAELALPGASYLARDPSPTVHGKQLMASSETFWWHSIDLGNGMVTPGQKSQALLSAEWEALRLPKLAGKSVLDIGTWDGFFAFEAERHGAARVVALDHYVWSLDLPRQQAYWRECQERGEPPASYHTVPELWQPDRLPGKRGFDVAHAAHRSGAMRSLPTS
jgi:tRNA (mo5U34)-methyltransferase